MAYITNTISNLLGQTAFFNLTWGNYLMIGVACFFLYLAIRHGFDQYVNVRPEPPIGLTGTLRLVDSVLNIIASRQRFI